MTVSRTTRSIVSVAWSQRAPFPGAMGQYAEAEPLYQRILAIDENLLGKEESAVAEDLNTLAEVYVAHGKYAEAEPLFQRSLSIVEKAFGPEHRTVVRELKNYAALLRKMQRGAEASVLEARAAAIAAKQAQ